MRTPNLFIVGAPKCGTTSLDNYLRQHPDVFMSTRKEPHFFGTDLTAPRFIRDWDEYCALFSGATDEKIVGETSVWYLYSTLAAQEIHSFCPTAKIIIMLRHPVEQMHSLHSQRLYSGLEDISNFADALEAEGDRKKGRRIPPHSEPVEGLFYREVVSFAHQVERYYKLFPHSNIHVVLFDEMKLDALGAFRRVCEFLNIEESFVPDLVVYNPNKTARSRRLLSAVRRPPNALRVIARILLPVGRLRAVLRKVVSRSLTVTVERAPLEDSLARKLAAEFEPGIRLLESIIGRDLSSWTDTHH